MPNFMWFYIKAILVGFLKRNIFLRNIYQCLNNRTKMIKLLELRERECY